MASEPLTSLGTADRWREVCAQLRATDDISFKLLGFVPLFTVAAIGAVLFKADHRLSLGLVLASFVGSLTTLGFWIWERRNIQTCKWLRERAADIERAALGPTHVGQFARLAKAPRGLGKTEGERIVYATTIAAWLCVPLLADADSIAEQPRHSRDAIQRRVAGRRIACVARDPESYCHITAQRQ